MNQDIPGLSVNFFVFQVILVLKNNFNCVKKSLSKVPLVDVVAGVKVYSLSLELAIVSVCC